MFDVQSFQFLWVGLRYETQHYRSGSTHLPKTGHFVQALSKAVDSKRMDRKFGSAVQN
jgi:hypothetical protein